MYYHLEISRHLAAPAIVTSLAYLNARWSLFYDWTLITGLAKIGILARWAERKDRLNLFYVLEKHAHSSRTANHPFIVYNGRTWSFQETYETSLRYGTWFQAVHGVKPKEIVAMDFMNSSTFLFICLGLWSIGAIPAFINYNLSGKPLTHSIKSSSARLLLVDDEVRRSFDQDQLTTLGSSDFRDGKGPVEVVFFTPAVEAQVLQTEAVRADDSVRGSTTAPDMAILIYTSGTTGLPKPAIVSWKKCWGGATFPPHWMGLRRTDRLFTVGAPSKPLLTFVRVNAAVLTQTVHASLPLLGHPFGLPTLSDVCNNAHRRSSFFGAKVLERGGGKPGDNHPVRG